MTLSTSVKAAMPIESATTLIFRPYNPNARINCQSSVGSKEAPGRPPRLPLRCVIAYSSTSLAIFAAIRLIFGEQLDGRPKLAEPLLI
jgi:hypothetical protein